jgi:hypothetical protein
LFEANKFLKKLRTPGNGPPLGFGFGGVAGCVPEAVVASEVGSITGAVDVVVLVAAACSTGAGGLEVADAACLSLVPASLVLSI